MPANRWDKKSYERIREMRARRESSGLGIEFDYRDETGRAAELRRSAG